MTPLFRNLMLAIVTATLVVGCGNPVPTEKSDYVGEWQHPTMYLLITQDGSVKYKRLGGDATKSVEAPLKAFNGDNFTVGIGPMKTTFVVSEPPRQEGEKWVMVVDGVQLTRTATLR